MAHAFAQLLALVITLLTLGSVRLLLVIRATHDATSPLHKRGKKLRKQGEQASLAVFLGSGGHTAEMIRLISSLDWERYTFRTYLIGQGDTMSEEKALALEKTIDSGAFRILRIPRARRVHQSYLTSPFTTLHSLAYCLWYISISPILTRSSNSRAVLADVILLNGPGSCVPIVLSAFIPRVSSRLAAIAIEACNTSDAEDSLLSAMEL